MRTQLLKKSLGLRRRNQFRGIGGNNACRYYTKILVPRWFAYVVKANLTNKVVADARHVGKAKNLGQAGFAQIETNQCSLLAGKCKSGSQVNRTKGFSIPGIGRGNGNDFAGILRKKETQSGPQRAETLGHHRVTFGNDYIFGTVFGTEDFAHNGHITKMALEVFTATNTGIKKLAQRNDESRQYQSRHKPLAVIALFVGQYGSGGTGLVQHLIIGHIGGFGNLHLRTFLQKEGVDGVVEFVTAFQCQKISFQFGQVADATGQSSKLPAQLGLFHTNAFHLLFNGYKQ